MGTDEYYDEDYTYTGSYRVLSQYQVQSSERIVNLYTQSDPTSTNTICYTFLGYHLVGEKLGETTSYNSTHNDFYDTFIGYYYKWDGGFLGLGSHHNIYVLGKEFLKENLRFTGQYKFETYGSYARAAHAEKEIFNYSSYLLLHETNIVLILDYYGKQKMILSYEESGVTNAESSSNFQKFFITREVHYSRNIYNRDSSGSNYNALYPTFYQLPVSPIGWYEPPIQGQYFHRLVNNSSNRKYLKEGAYYDSITNRYANCEFELVYNGTLTLSTIVNDPLVTYTFNFGVKNTYNDSDQYIDAHYTRDVYPYLIWGNNLADYVNHSPFERFIWDKESSAIITLLTLPAPARDLSGSSLISYYNNGGLFPIIGIPIPTCVINGRAIMVDRTAPFFSYITNKTISINNTSCDWTILMVNISDNMSGVCIKSLVYSDVVFGVEGVYSVTLLLTDVAGNSLERTFQVTISASAGGGNTHGPGFGLPDYYWD
jgi:hypothetical protein